MKSLQEIRDILMQDSPHVARTTAPLLGDFNGRPDHFASCVLLKIAESHFVLTAAHVTDDIVREGVPAYFPTPSLDDRPIRLEGTSLFETPVGQTHDRYEDPYDLAVIELKPEIANRLSTFMRFLTLDDIEPHYLRLPPADFAIFGYPCALTNRNEEEKTIVATVMPYFTSLHEHDRAPVRFDPHIHILMDLQRPSPVEGDEYGFVLPSAAGLSGCGMWRVKDLATPIELLDWRLMKLIGIAHWWDPSAEVIKGTKIKYILQILHDRRPHLRREINRRFPFPTLK
jgi:hypothetical protein